MPKARCTSYNLTFKLKVIAEAESVENNSEIAREYRESMVRRWRKDEASLFNGEIKLSAKRKTMGRYTPKYPKVLRFNRLVCKYLCTYPSFKVGIFFSLGKALGYKPSTPFALGF